MDEQNARGDKLRHLMDEWWQPPAELISTLPGRGGGPELSYLGHADTTRALIEADPFWTWEPMAQAENGEPVMDRDSSGNPVGLWVWLTVCGVRRPAYGSCEPGKREAVKELIGDAIRNGAMRFGVAGNLWSRQEANISDDQVQQIVAAAKEAGLDADQAKGVLQKVASVSRSVDVPPHRFRAVLEAMRSYDPEAQAKADAENAVKAITEQMNGEVVKAA